MGDDTGNILLEAARVWRGLLDYEYQVTYGYRRELREFRIGFQADQFHHLAGFQYLDDAPIPRYNRRRLLDRVLDGAIGMGHVERGASYESRVAPRLFALARLRDVLDGEFRLFAFSPRTLPFATTIKADYLVSAETPVGAFAFLASGTDGGAYACCSLFEKGERDFEAGQHRRTVLRKARVHLPTGAAETLFDRLGAAAG